MTTNQQLDPTDLRILNVLQKDGRMEIIHVASKVFKSPSTTLERIRKLQEAGFIEKFVAILNRRMVGRPTLMVTLVKLKGHSADQLHDFPAAVAQYPEVQVCLHLSGEFDFLLQITLRDPQEYEEFLAQKLCTLPMIDKLHSSVVLKECKMDSALPLG